MAHPLDCLASQPGWLIDSLNKIFSRQDHFEKINARLRQRTIAAELGDNRRSSNGFGRPRLEVDTYAYHYWGQRLGYKCWKDKQFLREFERDNPDARVKAKGTKEIHVGWNGAVEARERTRRFTKSYG